MASLALNSMFPELKSISAKHNEERRGEQTKKTKERAIKQMNPDGVEWTIQIEFTDLALRSIPKNVHCLPSVRVLTRLLSNVFQISARTS